MSNSMKTAPTTGPSGSETKNESEHHGDNNNEDDDDDNDEGSLKSYLKMDQIFLPMSSGAGGGGGGGASDGNHRRPRATASSSSGPSGRRHAASTSQSRQPPPWYLRHADAESTVSDDSNHLFMSEPSMSEADSSEHPFRLRLSSPLGPDPRRQDDDYEDDEDDADDLGMPPPPPQLISNLHYPNNHAPPQVQPQPPSRGNNINNNNNNSQQHQNHNPPYRYNHYYHQFNPVPLLSAGIMTAPLPNSPGNTSLSSWESSGMARRVLIHVSPPRSRGDNHNDHGEETSDNTTWSGSRNNAINHDDDNNNNDNNNNNIARSHQHQIQQQQQQHDQHYGLSTAAAGAGAGAHERRSRKSRQYPPSPPPYPSVRGGNGGGGGGGGGGAKTPDRISNGSHSNSTSPASEGQLQQLDQFLDDLRVHSEGRVQEFTGRHSGDGGGGGMASDNVSLELSLNGPVDVQGVLRRPPSPSPPVLVVQSRQFKRPPTPPMAGPSPQQPPPQQQHERVSSVDTAIIQNTSGSFTSSLDLLLSEMAGDDYDDDGLGVGEDGEDLARAPSYDTRRTLVMALSDSDAESDTTPVETILNEKKMTDREAKDVVGIAVKTVPESSKEFADRAASLRRPRKHPHQKSSSTSSSADGGDGGDNSSNNAMRSTKGGGKPPGPHRQHRRQRSGDAAAATLATGSTEWKGMTLDQIPVPGAGGADEVTADSGSWGKKNTIDRVEEWKKADDELNRRTTDERDGEISKFSSFALGTSVGNDTPVRHARRTKQVSDRRMRTKNNSVDSDSSSHASTEYNQFFHPPPLAPPALINYASQGNQRGASSPTLSGYSISPVTSVSRKSYPPSQLSPAAASFQLVDKDHTSITHSQQPPTHAPTPSWSSRWVPPSPVYYQPSPQNQWALHTPYYVPVDNRQRNLSEIDPLRPFGSAGVNFALPSLHSKSTSELPNPPYRTTASPMGVYPAFQLPDRASPFHTSDSSLLQNEQDYNNFMASQAQLHPHHSMSFEWSPPTAGIRDNGERKSNLFVKTGVSTCEARPSPQRQNRSEGGENDEESFVFSETSSVGSCIDIERERNIHLLHDSQNDHRVVRHHLPDSRSAGSYDGFGGNQSKKVDRRQFLPQTSTVDDDKPDFPTYVCPVCNTRQRRFFTVSSAPRQFESAGGYIAFYFGVYVIASLYIFGLQEGWSKLDCIYFAVITLTTAGLGDFVPTTDGAKIICSIFIYFGVACIGLLLGSYIAGMLDDRSHKEALANQVKACPNCARIQNFKDTAERRRQNFKDTAERRRQAISPNLEAEMSGRNMAQLAQMHALSLHANADGSQERASKKLKPSDFPKYSQSERGLFPHPEDFSTPKASLRKNPEDDSFSLVSPAREKYLLGSPTTTQILARQSHSRHVSIDLGTNYRGLPLGSMIPPIPPLSVGDTSTRRARNYSFDVPATVQEGVQTKDGAAASGTHNVANTDQGDDTDTPPPPPPPVDPTQVSTSGEFLFEDSSESDSSTSDDEELDEHNAGVKNAKYVFLTLREALINSMVIIAFGCLGFYLTEDFPLIDSWYFSTVLLTTVGYGDIVPITEGGKLFATVYLLVAGTILLHNMSMISMIPLELRKRRTEQAVLTQFGDSLDDDALRELATGPIAQRLNLASRDLRGLEQCTRETFSLVMLIRLGKVTEQDIKLAFAAFRRLDVNNEGVLDSKSIIGGMIQKRRKSHFNLAGLGKSSQSGHSNRPRRHQTRRRPYNDGQSSIDARSTHSSGASSWVPNIGSWIPGPSLRGPSRLGTRNTSSSSALTGSSVRLGTGTERSVSSERAPLLFSTPSTHSYGQQSFHEATANE